MGNGDLKTERTRLRRVHERGHYDPGTLYPILDAMPLAHIGYQMEGHLSVLPTLQWREGDHLYWHGSSASRALRAMEGADVCVTVTLIDGYVLARSAFHHSVNYRAAMVFGRAEKITGSEEKAGHLETMVDMLFPGRRDELRPMSGQELKATAVMRIPITEASAKIRNGPPQDDEADYALPIWAGILPIGLQTGAPIADPRNRDGLATPDHIGQIRIGQAV